MRFSQAMLREENLAITKITPPQAKDATTATLTRASGSKQKMLPASHQVSPTTTPKALYDILTGVRAHTR